MHGDGVWRRLDGIVVAGVATAVRRMRAIRKSVRPGVLVYAMRGAARNHLNVILLHQANPRMHFRRTV